MIPGPIEFEPDVIQAMGSVTTSHVAPNFINTFGNSIEMMREVWLTKTAQPFIVSGSGTLAMDMAAANLIETNDNVLVISTGYFGERFAEICKRYGANVTMLSSEIGNIVSLETIEKELTSKKYKLVTMTHVDTSTGVVINPEPISKLAKKYGVLSILDGVCSVAGEEIQQDAWELDVVLTASQKAVGVPPGLALLTASKQAMEVFKNRKTPVGNYYADFTNWLPIMNAYENRQPSYFGTPPVNLIAALEASFKFILNEGMHIRFERHKKMATAFREAMLALGLKLVPVSKENSANTLTAVYFPENINGSDFLKNMSNNNVIIAGGLLKAIKSNYFRVGHMGSVNGNDILATVAAIEKSLKLCGYQFSNNFGITTAQDILLSN